MHSPQHSGRKLSSNEQPSTEQSSKELRVVLYSHDSQGLGHTRRNLALAHSLAANLPGLTGRTVTGLLVTGESQATRFDSPDDWDWVVLPGISKGSDGYAPRNLAIDQSKLIRLRAQIMDAVLSEFRPHLVVVDRHAFGVDQELIAALSELKKARPGCKVVLGLREILDTPKVARREWKALGDLDRLREYFDELWVYGDPTIHDPVKSGEIPGKLAPMVRYTGYLAAGRQSRRRTGSTGKPYILTMAGGGSDGKAVLLTAAKATVPHGYEHLIVTGPQMPKEDRVLIEQSAAPGTRVISMVRDGLAEMREAAAIVSMGGYNSVCEIMSTNTPALVVPRVSPRREQLIRAESLARHELTDMCHPDQLTPQVLTDWFITVVGTPSQRVNVDLNGLQTVGGYAAELLGFTVPAPHTDHLNDWQTLAAV
ncbi:glycosyltransferase family protein [Arthrobacter sp. CAN_A1]|uniref:glycosyltransferase family protein n=1 Tax=Arthrobacter sp. CAN_A1 TaxID=2787717 RepID=UPI0018CA1E0B